MTTRPYSWGTDDKFSNTQLFDLESSKVIGILGSARTGSTYVANNLLSSMRGNLIYLAELFNPWQPVSELLSAHDDDIIKIMYEKTGTSNPQAMLRKFREEPVDTIRFFMDTYENIFGKSIFAVKIFDQHLTDENLKDALGCFDGVMYTKRNFFDSYVSLKIAQDIEKWSHVDTSKKKIKPDYDDMMRTYTTITSWEVGITRMYENLGMPSRVIEYETLHAEGKDEMKKSIEVFDIFCDLCGIDKKERDYQKLEKRMRNSIDDQALFVKQNKNKDILDSIEDEYREEFKKFMERWEYDARCLRE